MLEGIKDFLRRERAAFVRRTRTSARYVAVTGSSAKTTTTDMIGQVLAEAGPAVYFSGYNGLKHVAENISSIGRDVRFVVQEVHGGGPGMAREAAAIIRPDVAVVTVVGLEHTNHLSSADAIAAAKSDLVAALPEDGLAILNADDARVRAMAGRTRARTLTFGTSPDADLRCTDMRMEFPSGLSLDVTYEGQSYVVRSKLLGKHWAAAILASTLAGLALGIEPRRCLAAIESYEPQDARCSVHPFHNGAMIVNDAYKAPEWSLDSFFELVSQVDAPFKTIVIGEITDSKLKKGRLFRRIARQAQAISDRTAFVGPAALRSFEGRDLYTSSEGLVVLPDVKSASDFLVATSRPGEVIFLKSSRSMHLDRIVRHQEASITCWRELCGRKIQCAACDLLRAPTNG